MAPMCARIDLPRVNCERARPPIARQRPMPMTWANGAWWCRKLNRRTLDPNKLRRSCKNKELKIHRHWNTASSESIFRRPCRSLIAHGQNTFMASDDEDRRARCGSNIFQQQTRIHGQMPPTASHLTACTRYTGFVAQWQGV